MPDVEIKPQVYKDPRPKEAFDRYHALVRDHEPESKVYEIVRICTVVWALLAYLAPNHASFMDHFFTGAFIRRRVQFMGKSQLFKGIGAWVFSHGGVFPVRRGQQDEEAFVTAFRILARGGAVVMYCEGGRSRTGQLAAEARPGIGRLALESGVPVVPVAILGSYQVRNWKRLQFPKVTVQFGRPFRFETVKQATREQQQEAATYILERIRELHTELSRVGRRGARRAARAGLTSLSKG
jgi:1-acyl-sn-glycerol-3-phosphate acyltransferase